MTSHETYMHRCIALAKNGAGHVAPNPMVGSVLVHEGRIIGEGFHRIYGQAHAEVNCINSVKEDDKHLIPQSTIYVSLEPCAHFGKTPPCADRIIHERILKVVVGCRDPFKQVDGKGIEKLQNAGAEVTMNVLENECRELNKRFFTFHTNYRPYIILKWAQSNNGKIGGSDFKRINISNDFSNRLVHKWRSDEAAIMVGTNTAFHDNPSLTTRLWKGSDPVRIFLDMELKVPSTHQILDNSVRTIIFNKHKHSQTENIEYYQISEDTSIVHQITNALYQLQVQSVLIEGGTRLLQSFIDEGYWDEARIITNDELMIDEGIQAPSLTNALKTDELRLLTDRVDFFTNNSRSF
ncbi:bifunctional diaminohydroxyphosphoribosylaminopyrimidine deaminase/5-amino-6-(5-phosphoribosylamino)uracil reductase RibD [Pinibacter soli]|uniref:Riboflavin biosynthesis protein RibD n=1 Tax=Pinibacter soli TaxID=3044211 RepID=A0ABT6RGW8_9BACT|nr:bifunctional diaminohydroxyphosphoribosylaminopyrimidine deaminase/5-amino-6-(5-phosphoribosylamino)uracil reductase RibD [Pinibacter soli]MDI3321819.1 bifunctional diaminohydroxyphosphoribosylaminopyrimidine deaminase/5-amino-6-(5-phosphoribosylamino)uracil reductase RibD [Pinibacter soli]